ncbi:hypothetical protein JI435_413250, partial [Parastagonospora nodorum SN15]
ATLRNMNAFGHVWFPFIFPASSVIQRWHDEYSHFRSTRFSKLLHSDGIEAFERFYTRLGRLFCTQRAILLHLMVNDDEKQKKKDYEDWPHGHMTDITTKK